MTLPSTDTVVLYPAGSTRNGATVLHAEIVADGRIAVVLDETVLPPRRRRLARPGFRPRRPGDRPRR